MNHDDFSVEILCELMCRKIEYINGIGLFEDPCTVVAAMKNKSERELKAKNFVFVVGCCPHYSNIAGRRVECGIPSDDTKTLIVGAAYIGLECAGFFHGLGYDLTVMVRSTCSIQIL